MRHHSGTLRSRCTAADSCPAGRRSALPRCRSRSFHVEFGHTQPRPNLNPAQVKHADRGSIATRVCAEAEPSRGRGRGRAEAEPIASCTHTHDHARAQARTHTLIYACMYAYICVRMHVCTSACVQIYSDITHIPPDGVGHRVRLPLGRCIRCVGLRAGAQHDALA